MKKRRDLGEHIAAALRERSTRARCSHPRRASCSDRSFELEQTALVARHRASRSRRCPRRQTTRWHGTTIGKRFPRRTFPRHGVRLDSRPGPRAPVRHGLAVGHVPASASATSRLERRAPGEIESRRRRTTASLRRRSTPIAVPRADALRPRRCARLRQLMPEEDVPSINSSPTPKPPASYSTRARATQPIYNRGRERPRHLPRPPAPVNEPPRGRTRPEVPNAIELRAARRDAVERIEIPCVIGGKDVEDGEDVRRRSCRTARSTCSPTSTRAAARRWSKRSPPPRGAGATGRARRGRSASPSSSARPSCSPAPGARRSTRRRCSTSRRRRTRPRSTPPASSIDFWRFNAEYLVRIYSRAARIVAPASGTAWSTGRSRASCSRSARSTSRPSAATSRRRRR